MAHLAQLNIARMKTAYEDPSMKDFVDALEPMHELSDRSPGSIWRLDSGLDPEPDLVSFEASGWLVNMSVWRSIEDLKSFVMSPFHLSIMRRRAEWFEKSDLATMVLWWIPEGNTPTFTEAMERLETLRERGPTVQAFSFARPFPCPDED